MKLMKSVSLLLTVVALGFGSLQAKTLVNVDKTGLGIQGYDPVAFFTDHKPVKGEPTLRSQFNGVTYQFATAEHKALFDQEPAKYEPAFGGYCAYGVSKGATAPIEVDAFQIVDGRLLMQYDKGVRDTFAKDPAGYLKKAENNWPGLVEKKGK